MYFHSFAPNSGLRGDYEILHRFPFKKHVNYDHHDVSIRLLYQGRCDPYAIGCTKPTDMHFVCDSNSLNSKLFHISIGEDFIDVRGRGNVLEKGNKILLEVQRSSENNFYWLEDSPTFGSTLRGVIDISH